jgi:hypothetical protein
MGAPDRLLDLDDDEDSRARREDAKPRGPVEWGGVEQSIEKRQVHNGTLDGEHRRNPAPQPAVRSDRD